MSNVTVSTTRRHPTSTWAVAGRWMLGFLGFPIGGLVAMTAIGAVDSTTAALAAGAMTGAILGTAQSIASPALPRVAWIAATAVGLSGGLAVGSTLVDFDTSLGALATQGAICGAVIGLAQAAVLAQSTTLGAWRSALWVPFLAACWALGWTITTSAGVDVERQYTVFGASGAIVVTALTALLPLTLRRPTVASGV
jgi:hypothetical protein